MKREAWKRETWKWVWLLLLLADVFWELTAFFVHGEPWDHLTISEVVKRWEGIDPVTGRPVETPVGLIKRGCVLAALVGVCVVLVLHWVVQVI